MPNELYTPVDFVQLSLATPLNMGVTNEMLVNEDISSLEPKGWLVIRDPISGDEVIEYTGKDAVAKKLTGLVRAVAGADASHDAGRSVFGATTAQYVKQLVDRIVTFSSDDHQISTRRLSLKDTTTLIISSGAVTISRSAHILDTEAGGAFDHLETINGGIEGDLLYLRILNNARTVTLKHGVGNLRSADGSDVDLTSTHQEVTLKHNGSHWLIVTSIGSTRKTLPQSYLTGLGLSNNGSDLEHDLDIAVGEARDDSNLMNLRLDITLTKQLDVAFVKGPANGGRDSNDTLGSDQEYNVFVIGDSTNTKAIDVFFSTSSSPTLPTGFDVKRRIGSIFTDSSSNIINFIQRNNYFVFKERIIDLDDTSGTAETWETATISVPANTIGLIGMFAESSSDNRTGIAIRPVGVNADPLSGNTITQGLFYTDSGENSTRRISSSIEILVDENSQFQYTMVSNANWGKIQIATYGYIDSRGK